MHESATLSLGKKHGKTDKGLIRFLSYFHPLIEILQKVTYLLLYLNFENVSKIDNQENIIQQEASMHSNDLFTPEQMKKYNILLQEADVYLDYIFEKLLSKTQSKYVNC